MCNSDHPIIRMDMGGVKKSIEETHQKVMGWMVVVTRRDWITGTVLTAI